MSASIHSVAILGVGLIGGSVGMALCARGVRVLGIGRDPAKLARGVELGAIDEGTTRTDAENLRSVDVAVVCTPVDRIAADSLELLRIGSDRLLVTDAGSTKRAIVEAVGCEPIGRRRFVGAHPIAGAEKNGVENARAELFQNRVCVLTPTPDTPPESVARIRAFWETVGCRIEVIDPAEHDRRLARTSHLPHVAASALAAVVPPDVLYLAAGAYRDGTRVAAADGGLWTSIFLENRDEVLASVNELKRRLDRFESLLRAQDADGLRDWWEVGRRNRAAYDHQNS